MEFASSSDMKSALDKLDGSELNGRRIKLIEDRKRRRYSYLFIRTVVDGEAMKMCSPKMNFRLWCLLVFSRRATVYSSIFRGFLLVSLLRLLKLLSHSKFLIYMHIFFKREGRTGVLLLIIGIHPRC